MKNRRIAIIGNSGSGKSTLAQQIAAQLELEVLDLDTIAWRTDNPTELASTETAVACLQDFFNKHPAWIIEGCYEHLIGPILDGSIELVFLDPGEAACIEHCKNRPWEPHKYTSKAEQDKNLEFLLSWVKEYYHRTGTMSLHAHHALYTSYDGPKQRLFSACQFS
ncbi:MAG: hypothetical protein V2I41_11720 [Pseudomonadales bacterium]|jgi:adenylate kinase family enzyme|nr:hypothetical protein [Pseudomonadales bacterium]